ncbi:MAG: class I SAM-dependent methyltransferase [Candidatus Binataceae bacterium]
MTNDLNADWFRRLDDSDDELFYVQPRFVVHIDDGAIKLVGEIYEKRLPVGGAILDLMSSWRSHLPARLYPSRVTGLGLNRDEMRDNPALSEVVVHNVNRGPHLPFDDATFDGAVMTVSIQYLTRPLEVFTDVARVLRPRAPFIVTFSNRMFPTKAVAIWHNSGDRQRLELVRRYFAESHAFENIEVFDRGNAAFSDPIWGVAGYSSGPRQQAQS